VKLSWYGRKIPKRILWWIQSHFLCDKTILSRVLPQTQQPLWGRSGQVPRLSLRSRGNKQKNKHFRPSLISTWSRKKNFTRRRLMIILTTMQTNTSQTNCRLLVKTNGLNIIKPTTTCKNFKLRISQNWDLNSNSRKNLQTSKTLI